MILEEKQGENTTFQNYFRNNSFSIATSESTNLCLHNTLQQLQVPFVNVFVKYTFQLKQCHNKVGGRNSTHITVEGSNWHTELFKSHKAVSHSLDFISVVYWWMTKPRIGYQSGGTEVWSKFVNEARVMEPLHFIYIGAAAAPELHIIQISDIIPMCTLNSTGAASLLQLLLSC